MLLTGSTERSASIKTHPYRRGPDGRPLCRWCSEPVGKGRRSWCSDECVDQYMLLVDPNHARLLCYERDRGVCTLCKLDTVAFEKKARQRIKELKLGLFRTSYVTLEHPMHGQVEVPVWRDLWDADHIVPVSEGGGLCGLDNYRTLCLWCHKEVTREMHRRQRLLRQSIREVVHTEVTRAVLRVLGEPWSVDT